MVMTKQPLQTPAEKRWGYRFGERGVVPIAEAASLLGKSERTVERRIEQGYLRRGYAKPGVPQSGIVVCRRSLDDYLASLEC